MSYLLRYLLSYYSNSEQENNQFELYMPRKSSNEITYNERLEILSSWQQPAELLELLCVRSSVSESNTQLRFSKIFLF